MIAKHLSESSEMYRQMIEAGERFDVMVALVTDDIPAKGVHRKVVDDL